MQGVYGLPAPESAGPLPRIRERGAFKDRGLKPVVYQIIFVLYRNRDFIIDLWRL